MDYHLRFDTQQQASELLEEAGIPDGSSMNYEVSHIGPIDPDPSHFLNLRAREEFTAEQMAVLGSHLVFPQNPVRVWFDSIPHSMGIVETLPPPLEQGSGMDGE
jgi:hypothetical protein